MLMVTPAAIVNANVAVGHLYHVVARRSKTNLEDRSTPKATSWWIGLSILSWVCAWIIATILPVFHILQALIGAAFGVWFMFGLPGLAWLYMNWKTKPRGIQKFGLVLLNSTLFFGFGIVLCVLGVTGTIMTAAKAELTVHLC